MLPLQWTTITFIADYIKCDYCGRRFNEAAHTRHVDFCKEQKSRIPNTKPAISDYAKQRAAARTQVILDYSGFLFFPMGWGGREETVGLETVEHTRRTVEQRASASTQRDRSIYWTYKSGAPS